MPGRFPLYTDADIHGPLVAALIRKGWDVLRAIDRFRQGSDDSIHFEEAAGKGLGTRGTNSAREGARPRATRCRFRHPL